MIPEANATQDKEGAHSARNFQSPKKGFNSPRRGSSHGTNAFEEQKQCSSCGQASIPSESQGLTFVNPHRENSCSECGQSLPNSQLGIGRSQEKSLEAKSTALHGVSPVSREGLLASPMQNEAELSGSQGNFKISIQMSGESKDQGLSRRKQKSLSKASPNIQGIEKAQRHGFNQLPADIDSFHRRYPDFNIGNQALIKESTQQVPPMQDLGGEGMQMALGYGIERSLINQKEQMVEFNPEQTNLPFAYQPIPPDNIPKRHVHNLMKDHKGNDEPKKKRVKESQDLPQVSLLGKRQKPITTQTLESLQNQVLEEQTKEDLQNLQSVQPNDLPDVEGDKPRKSKEESKRIPRNTEGDPFTFMNRVILEHIKLQCDPLGVLSEETIRFKVEMYPRDLNHLPKAFREEVLASSIYVERTRSESFSICINKSEISNGPDQDRSSGETLQSNEEPREPSRPSEEDVQMAVPEEDQIQKQDSIEEGEVVDESNSEKAHQAKKRRSKSKYSKRTKKVSKPQEKTCLPKNLANYSWIRNTQENITILEEDERIKSEKTAEQNMMSIDPPTTSETEVQSKPAEQSVEQVVAQSDNNLIPVPSEIPWSYKSRLDLQTIEEIWDRVDYGYYHNTKDLMDDIRVIVLRALSTRCLNPLAKIYVTHCLSKARSYIESKKQEFKIKWRGHIEQRFATNMSIFPKTSNWYKSPGTKREYSLLNNYKIKVPSENQPGMEEEAKRDKEAIQKKMQTTKSAKCKGDCCLKIEDLGPFKLGVDVWETQCTCRGKRVECSEVCGCDPSVCQNRQMSLNQALVLEQDVEEKISWGIDLCTAVNFLHLLPRIIPSKVQSEFIEQKLVFAIQQQGDTGWDVRNALNFIINSESGGRFTEFDKELAHIIRSGIRSVSDNIERHFRVHSKGLGIFCKRKDGIKNSKLIIEYFGEIYSPWSWYEKQDVLKKGQLEKKLSSDLPDFYNIIFERHYDDPRGYDMLMVDPILYGNYSSRLSHSCNPNCSTIIQVKNSGYSIGMFAVKEIQYGEELCFNYCSFTESEKEFESAVCLCGSELCSGRFLQLSSDKKREAILKNYHNFVDRNYILYMASKYPDITPDDELTLQTVGLKESVLEGVPDWLKKWASLVCEYLLFEEQKYPIIMKPEFPNMSEADMKIDAKSVRDSKVSNVTITIDKVMNVLKSMKVFEAPIKDLTFQERYERMWVLEGSVKRHILEVLDALEECPEKQKCRELINSIPFVIVAKANEELYEKRFKQMQQILAQMSDMLRPVRSMRVQIPAFCDLLWIYAHTTTYFSPNEKYSKSKGVKQQIRKCDVRQETKKSIFQAEELEKCIYEGMKEYDPGFIYGQLVGWFKQTVDKPNASLSADRRGTLSLPDLNSFIASATSQTSVKTTKRKKRGEEDSDDEVILPKSNGTRSRPIGQGNEQYKQGSDVEMKDSIEPPEQDQTQLMKKQKKVPSLKIDYPHKKHKTRGEFWEHWPENFAKQWDVLCRWSFKNKYKMYGSLQFESLIKAGNDRERRLEYFNSVLEHLLKIK